MAWAIKHEDGRLAGWPTPLVFATRKEARARRDKLAHQAGFSLDVTECDLPVNCKEKIRHFRKGK